MLDTAKTMPAQTINIATRRWVRARSWLTCACACRCRDRRSQVDVRLCCAITVRPFRGARPSKLTIARYATLCILASYKMMSVADLEQERDCTAAPDLRLEGRVPAGHRASKRVRILELLRDGERTVGDLQDQLDPRRAGASQHLAALRRLGVVVGRRQGSSVFYEVRDPRVFELLAVARSIVTSSIEHTRRRSSGALPTPTRSNPESELLDELPRRDRGRRRARQARTSRVDRSVPAHAGRGMWLRPCRTRHRCP